MFLQEPTQAVPIPGLDSLFAMFKASPGISILTVFAFILIVVVLTRLPDIISYFKDRANKKEEIALKELELKAKKEEQESARHDDIVTALNNSSKTSEKVADAVDNNSAVISSLEKTFLVQFSEVKTHMLGAEARLSDKITSTAEKAAQASKLDKIAASLDRHGGEDICHGDHS